MKLINFALLAPCCASITSAACQTAGSPLLQRTRPLLQAAQGPEGRDTVRVRTLVASSGYRVQGIVAQRSGYYAVLAEQNGVLSLVFVRGAARPILFADPLPVGEVPPQEVRWFAFKGDTVDGLSVTFDDPVENIIGTAVFTLETNRLRKVFTDAPGTCRAAQLKDLNADSRLELITYTEDPSETDCGDQCHLVIAKQLDMSPAWVSVRQWTGTSWQDVSATFPQFYVDVAARYDGLSKWLSEASDAHWCRESWLADEQIVTNWTQRAKRLSSAQPH